MNERLQEVLKEVLKLSPTDRAQLVEEVLSSFEFPEREEIDRLWVEEAEDRISAYEEGKLKAKSLSDVYSDIEKL